MPSGTPRARCWVHRRPDEGHPNSAGGHVLPADAIRLPDQLLPDRQQLRLAAVGGAPSGELQPLAQGRQPGRGGVELRPADERQVVDAHPLAQTGDEVTVARHHQKRSLHRVREGDGHRAPPSPAPGRDRATSRAPPALAHRARRDRKWVSWARPASWRNGQAVCDGRLMRSAIPRAPARAEAEGIHLKPRRLCAAGGDRALGLRFRRAWLPAKTWARFLVGGGPVNGRAAGWREPALRGALDRRRVRLCE